MARIGSILVAAGAGTRVGGGVPKQFVTLGAEPMFVRALRPLIAVSSEIVVVTAPSEISTAERLLADAGLGVGAGPADGGPGDRESTGGDPGAAGAKRAAVTVVAGGERRQDSVRRGLEALTDAVEIVLVHDAARPFATDDLARRVVEAAERAGAAVPAIAVPDTVKRVEDSSVVATLDRGVLRLSQTPQGFARRVLEEAYRGLGDHAVTDDAQAVELAGGAVAVVEGDPMNTKVTTPLDLDDARARANREIGLDAAARAGLGSDTHRLVAGRRLVLGGVEIPFEKGLDGHSDADVATHAIMDALLGAVAAGDIGRHFPPDDPAYKDVSSLSLLKRVAAIVRERGHAIRSVDVTITAEAPKIAPHVSAMRRALAAAAGIGADAISVKATTTEGTGPEGEGLAISARAIAVVSVASP